MKGSSNTETPVVAPKTDSRMKMAWLPAGYTGKA